MGFPRIDPELLLERLGIDFVDRGEMLWASCPHPEHDDSDPSWRIIVDPDSERFLQHRCYGCGWGGWPVHLVEAVLGCTRKEAASWLHNIETDVPVPFEVAVEYQRSLDIRFRLPYGVKQLPLLKWESLPRKYLVEERGVKEWQVERWKIGYSSGRYHPQVNPLAGRIVFPVYNDCGRLIGYTGRSFIGAKRRYKEPSKEEGADLGAVFGERHWPKKKRTVVVVTEGAIDALAVERQFPGVYVGGIYGSQLHEGHIARLSTFDNILMCTDPDNAGDRVASELEQALRRWSQVVRVRLPEGSDPGLLAQKAPRVLYDALSYAFNGIYSYRDRSSLETRPRGCRRRTEVRFRNVRRECH